MVFKYWLTRKELVQFTMYNELEINVRRDICF